MWRLKPRSAMVERCFDYTEHHYMENDVTRVCGCAPPASTTYVHVCSTCVGRRISPLFVFTLRASRASSAHLCWRKLLLKLSPLQSSSVEIQFKLKIPPGLPGARRHVSLAIVKIWCNMNACTNPGTTSGRLLLNVASRVKADSSCNSSARNHAPVPLSVASLAQKSTRIKPPTDPAATTCSQRKYAHMCGVLSKPRKNGSCQSGITLPTFTVVAKNTHTEM